MMVSGACTVSVVLPVMVPCVAEIVVVPAATPLAKPAEVMVAVAVLDELQVTCAVMSLVVESAYVPVAVNCLVVPRMIVGLTGVTAIEVRAGAVPALKTTSTQ